MLNPDGPQGPAFVLKKGILHLSLQSGVPVVPVRLFSSAFHELNSWDRKRIPRPFSTIRFVFGDPVHVTEENFEHAHDLIERELGRSPEDQE